ncbi:MAG TPA: bifunctional homocysteine S-methyltransferase/methylenetetrahydrofolate reductase [Candidatus Mediterraneibacter surreyensis]|nr:bifunctional homocysteine S-methyltransferase/methylenetetrahydrofolate reductase [Candidatus Mediterraneibacter surreyensis]
MDFHTALKTRCLITDGAMGTYYSEKYGKSSGVPETDNLSEPDKIEEIHREYIEAGADILRTNSFASNIRTLCRGKDNQTREEQLKTVYENVAAACRIAQSAVEREQHKAEKEGRKIREIYIAGDIGPVPERRGDEERDEEIAEEYKTMVKAHLDAGIRVIWFETFADLDRILPVAEWIRCVSDAFIMASFSVNAYGHTRTGLSMQELFRTVRESGLIDGIGFNCGIGPSHLGRLLKRQDLGDMIVSAVPNAGYADRIENRMVYRDNAGYFCEAMEKIADLGVNIIGGCCGTSPVYIRKLARAAGNREPAKRLSDSPEQRAASEIRYDNNLFIRKIYSGEKAVIAELDPPFDGNDKKMISAAAILKQAGVEMITFSDSPMGKMRASAAMSAVKAANQLQIETMPHIACRDRNAIGIGSEILGAYMNGIRNFLVVTGDPVPSGERGSVTSVYDYHSVTLMNYLRQLNREYFSDDPIAYGGALNYGRKNIDAEIRRMQKKCEAGASFFLTQPIYSDEDIERIRYIKSRIDTKIICGIMPLVSYRNALFMKNEITGINVPDEIIAQYDKDMSREEAQAVGVRIAVKIAEKSGDVADGYYFMVPFNRAEMIAEILEKMTAIDEISRTE